MINKHDVIDVIGTKGDKVVLIITEGRKWEDIDNYTIKTLVKINNYKSYTESEEFRKKYKNKKIEIILDSQYEPPKIIKKMLNDEKVILSINHSYLKKSS